MCVEPGWRPIVLAGARDHDTDGQQHAPGHHHQHSMRLHFNRAAMTTRSSGVHWHADAISKLADKNIKRGGHKLLSIPLACFDALVESTPMSALFALCNSGSLGTQSYHFSVFFMQ